MPWRWCSTPGTCGELKTVKAFPSDGNQLKELIALCFFFFLFFLFFFWNGRNLSVHNGRESQIIQAR